MSNEEKAAALKGEGNACLKAQDFQGAIDKYTAALELHTNHVFYSNRSAAYLSMGNAAKALEDGIKCIETKPDWPKGYGRKGAALHKLGMLEKAMEAYQDGLKVKPNDAALTQGCNAVIKAIQAQQAQGIGQIFQPGYMDKLKANPKTAAYLEDPNFSMMLQAIEKQPQLMMMLMQQDQRFRDVLTALTGMDLSGMAPPTGGPNVPKAADDGGDAPGYRGPQTRNHWAPPKKKDEEKTEEQLAAEKAEADAKAAEDKAAAEEAARLKPMKDKAKAFKDAGNALYKEKKFTEAIEQYQQAAETDPSDMAFVSNVAAALFGMKEYQQCADKCDEALAVGKQSPNRATFDALAKVMGRKGNALGKLGKWDDAIQAYNDALLESYDKNIEKKLKLAKKKKKKMDEEAYWDAELGLEAKERGNVEFKGGNFVKAQEEYSEAIKRDPKNAVYYCNRAAAYTKLMAFDRGLQDCEMCLKLKPDYVKAIGRKGCIQFFLKKYNNAMTTFREGLALDPNDWTCKDGLNRTVAKVNSLASSGEQDPERVKEAMKDPEIQAILRDPVVNSALSDMSTDPKAAARIMADPGMRSKIEKLIAAGVVSMGGPAQ